MKLFGREPAVWIGLLGTIALGIITTLAGQGFVSDLTAGKLTDGVNAVVQLATLLAPLIAGILIRGGVTPTTAPKLDVGTVVTTPSGAPAAVKLTV